VVGDDLAGEVMARALAAAGVGHLRLVRRTGSLPAPVAAALVGSNPELKLETRAWPPAVDQAASGAGPGAAWLEVLTGATVALRSGFDDDPMLRAAVRLGVPLVVARVRDDGVDVVSFRRHGPCPHAPLDVPTKDSSALENGGPGAVIAAELAATEALVLIAGAIAGSARARHVSVSFNEDVELPARAADIPWAPECFACGGSGSEMSFA
jgi:hypothetical protein